MPRVRGGASDGIPYGALSGEAWRGTGVPRTTSAPLPHGGGPYLSGIFPGSADVPQMPSGGSEYPHQPPGSLCTMPCAGQNYDPR